MTLSFSLRPSIVTRVGRDGVGRLWVGRRGGHDPDVIRIECEACGGSGESFVAVLDGAESRQTRAMSPDQCQATISRLS